MTNEEVIAKMKEDMELRNFLNFSTAPYGMQIWNNYIKIILNTTKQEKFRFSEQFHFAYSAQFNVKHYKRCSGEQAKRVLHKKTHIN